MKTTTIKLLGKGIALSLLTSTLLHATNGDHLIAVGAKARGMGGAGIAMSHGAESALANPALITSVKGTEISFGATIFMPDIKMEMGQAARHSSAADLNLIPEVSIAHKINENFYVGIGMWGTAGMGVDYRDAPTGPGDSGNMHMVTNLQLMQFAVPLAYKMENFSIAIAPVIQYGSLDINYDLDSYHLNFGSGVSQDFGFGVDVGATYDFENGLVLGAVYKSKIDMEYSNQLFSATKLFAALGIFQNPMADHLEQPAEIGIGLAYTMQQHTFAFDYKQIQWGDAKGYKDFGWQDQDVFAAGYQYTQNNWALRVGYNHASHPIKDAPSAPVGSPNPAEYAGEAVNLFNLLGFPATAEDHYTLGGTYEFSDTFSLDMAYVYAPETETTMNTLIGPSTVYHMENSLSFQLTYEF